MKELKDYLYHEFDNGKLFCGNVLDVLKAMPDESVNCVVTSPPYYSHRNYSTESQIWDGDENCKHEWIENYQPARGWFSENANVGNNAKIKREAVLSNFCNKCSAWKGSLGQEPNFELFVLHLANIFLEIKRILKKDGVVFVNLGDTYISKGATRHAG